MLNVFSWLCVLTLRPSRIFWQHLVMAWRCVISPAGVCVRCWWLVDVQSRVSGCHLTLMVGRCVISPAGVCVRCWWLVDVQERVSSCHLTLMVERCVISPAGVCVRCGGGWGDVQKRVFLAVSKPTWCVTPVMASFGMKTLGRNKATWIQWSRTERLLGDFTTCIKSAQTHVGLQVRGSEP